METFNNLSNKLIKEIDSIAREPKEPVPMKNTLKTITKAISSTNFGSQSVYNNTFSVEIPRSFDNLAQVYVKCTLSNGSVASTAESYLGTKIFKYIRIRTKNGLVLQTFTPRYLQSRMDQVFDSPIYTYLALGVQPDVAFTIGGADPTLFVPLFPFFSESELTFLRTMSMEQLEIQFVTNSSKEAMGLSVDLTNITTELHCLYHDQDNSTNKVDRDGYTGDMPHLPRYVKNSYSMFEEDTLTVLSGATSARLLLRCPHPLFSLSAALVDASSNRAQIKTMKLSFGDRVFLELDYRINYQNYGDNKSFLENGTFTYFFSKLKERAIDSGLITFTEEMFPVYLDITFDALGSNYSLYVFEEYRTYFSIDDRGFLSLSEDIQGWRENQKQANSSTAAADLTE